MNNKIFFHVCRTFAFSAPYSPPILGRVKGGKTPLWRLPLLTSPSIGEESYAKVLVLLFSNVFIAAVPLVVSAAPPDPGPVNSVLESVLNLSQVLTQIGITAAFVVFGWGIIRLILAAHNPATLKQAKGIMWWGIIGLFVLSSLFGIIAFIKIYIGIPDNAIINVPTFLPNSLL